MKLTLQIKLLPTPEQARLLDTTMQEYISCINDILDYAIAIDGMPKLSSAYVHAPLPATLRGQCCLDAKSIYYKTLKHGGKFPTLKKPVAIWNNQNYTVGTDFIAMPFFNDGKAKKQAIPAAVPEGALEKLSSCRLGTLRVTRKNGKYIAQIAYEAQEASSTGTEVMGIDLGIKCPAVAKISDGTTRFYGNGRQNKYIRRRFAKRRKKLGKAKKTNAIHKSADKEQRWMRDQDHKISRAIVNDAIAHNVGIIKLEAISGIRRTARTSRKNNRSLHSWSFYRLAHYIEYKAALVGIIVEYVDPAYTSQTCPVCGERHHAQDRAYVCPDCGYSSHRDIIGATNILAA